MHFFENYRIGIDDILKVHYFFKDVQLFLFFIDKKDLFFPSTTKESASEGIMVKRIPSNTLISSNWPSFIAWACERVEMMKKNKNIRMVVLYSKIHIILRVPIC